MFNRQYQESCNYYKFYVYGKFLLNKPNLINTQLSNDAMKPRKDQTLCTRKPAAFGVLRKKNRVLHVDKRLPIKFQTFTECIHVIIFRKYHSVFMPAAIISIVPH